MPNYQEMIYGAKSEWNFVNIMKPNACRFWLVPSKFGGGESLQLLPSNQSAPSFFILAKPFFFLKKINRECSTIFLSNISHLKLYWLTAFIELMRALPQARLVW